MSENEIETEKGKWFKILFAEISELFEKIEEIRKYKICRSVYMETDNKNFIQIKLNFKKDSEIYENVVCFHPDDYDHDDVLMELDIL